eukprot:5791726-Heterocapsa_arctica.AAC.1
MPQALGQHSAGLPWPCFGRSPPASLAPIFRAASTQLQTVAAGTPYSAAQAGPPRDFFWSWCNG